MSSKSNTTTTSANNNSQTKRAERQVIVADIGTYCDHALMAHAIESIVADGRAQSRSITYLTNESNAFANSIKSINVVPYDMPDFMTTVGTTLADPKTSIASWALRNPRRAMQLSSFMSSLAAELERLLLAAAAAGGPAVVVVSYSMMPVLFRISKEALDAFLARCPIVVLHYAPAYPNASLPWLFDSSLKQRHIRLFRTSKEFNVGSHEAYYRSMATYMGVGEDNVWSTLAKMTHVACYDARLFGDQRIVPARGIDVISAEPLVMMSAAAASSSSSSNLHASSSSSSLQKARKKTLIFVTFGSYAKEPVMAKALASIIPQLDAWCDEKNLELLIVFKKLPGSYRRAVFHDPAVYIPYADVVPRAALVVFTGSLCLHHVCRTHGVPMLFVPLIAEQYFWAKAYLNLTGIDYVDVENIDRSPTQIDVHSLIQKHGESCLAPAARASSSPRLPSVGSVVGKLLVVAR